MTGAKKMGKLNRASKSYRSSRKVAAILCAVAGFGVAHQAYAQSAYTGPSGSTGTPLTGDWNTAANWSPAGIPTGSASTILQFGGSGATTYTSTNDISNLFSLNQLQLSSSATVAETLAGDSLAFGSAPSLVQSGTGAFNISSAIALNDNLSITGTGTGGLNLIGVISGSFGVNKSSSDALTLSGTNTFTGGVTLTAGSVAVAVGGGLGTGMLTIATGASTSPLTVANTAATTIGNAINLPAPASSTTYVFTKTAASSSTGTVMTLSGVISGGGSGLTLEFNSNTAGDNTTTYYLTGTNTFVGNVDINRGIIEVNNAASLGAATNTLILDSNANTTAGNLQFGASFTLPNPVQLNASYPIGTNGYNDSLSGVVSGGGALVKVGAGTLTLLSTNSYTGATTVNAGALIAAYTASIPNYSSPGKITVASGATIAGRAGGSTDWTSANLDTLRGEANFSSGSFFGIDTTDGNFTYNSSIGSYNSAIGFNKLGTNTLTLGITNIYTGGTNIAGGTLALGVNNAVPANSALVIDNRSVSSSLGLGAFNQSISSLTLYAGSGNRTIISGTGTLQLNGNVTLVDSHTSGQDYPLIIAAPIDLDGATRTFTLGYGNNNDSSDLGDLRINSVISTSTGTAGITVSPQSSSYPGTLTLGTSNTYNGPTTLSSYVSLYLTANNAIPNGSALVMGTSTTLDLTAAGHSTGVSTGIGSLTGTGTIKLGSTGLLTIGYDNTSPAAFSGVINGSGGSITKTGLGALILSGTNTYTGATTVNGGRLEIDGSLATGSAVAVNSTGTLNGTGIVAGPVTINNGGTLTAGISGAGTLTLGSLTLGTNSGDVSTLNVTQLGTIAVTGNLTLTSGATSTINIGGAASGFSNGSSYPLITYNGTALPSLSGISVGTLPSRVLGSLAESTSGSSNSINFVVSGVDFPVWTGAASSQWNTSDVDWVLNSNNATTTTYLPGDSVLFSNLAGAGHTTVNINGSDVFPSGVTFNTSLNYTLAGSNGINGSTGLSVSGGGSLTINNVNSFTGNVNVSSATVTVASIGNSGVAGPLGAGAAVSLNSGTLTYTGTTASTNRGISIGSGGGTFNITNSSTALTLATGLTGTGTLAISGGGSLVMGAASTGFSGPIVVNSSNLSVSGDTQLGAVPASVTPAAITLNGTGTLTTTAGFTLNGNRGITGSGSLIVNGGTLVMTSSDTYTGGTLLKSGALSVANGMELGTGTLNVSTGASTSFLTVANTNAVTIPNAIILPAVTAAQTSVILKNSVNSSTGTQVTFAGNISGGSSLLTLEINASSSGDSTTSYSFTGTNSFLGNVLINRGYVVVNNPSSLGSASVELYSNQNTTLGNLLFNGSFTLANQVRLDALSGSPTYAFPIGTNGNNDTLSGPVIGSGPFQKVGAGTLTLTGTNNWGTTYPGTYVSAGTLQIGNGGTTGTLPGQPVSVSSGAALAFSRSDTVTFASVISGAGSVNQVGPGTLILTATNTFTGATNVNGGKLEMDGLLTASPVTVNSGGTLTGVGVITGPVNVTNSGAIATTGTLTVGSLALGVNASDTSSLNFTSTSVSGGSPTLSLINDTGAFTINSGANTVTVNVAGLTLATGDYQLVDYNGSASTLSSITSFKLGTLPSGVTATLYNNTGNNSLDLNVTGGDYPKWTGALSSEWVTTPQPSPHNWQLYYDNTPTDYADGNAVAFDDSASNYNVDISSGNVSPSSVSFLNNGNAYTITGANGIAGSTGVTMSGYSTVIFSNFNTYSGDTVINNGTVEVTTGSTPTTGPLGTGTIRLGAATSSSNSANLFLGASGSAGGLTLSNPIVVQSGSTGTLTIAAQNTSGINSLTGGITIGTGATTQTLTLLAATGGELDVNGNISDNGAAGSLILGNGSNTGTIKLNGTNTFGGSITVNGGTVVANNTVVPPYVNQLVINGGSTFVSNGTLTLTPTKTGAITSNNSIVSVSGGGTLALNNSNASLTNPDLTANLPSNSYYALTVATNISLSAGNHFIVGAGGNNTYSEYGSGDLGITGQLSGPGNLTVYGTPYSTQFELALFSDNTPWTGNLTIARGYVATPANNALTGNNSVSFTPAAGQVAGLYLSAQNLTIANLSGTGAGSMYIRNGSEIGGTEYGANVTLTVNQTAVSTFGGVISNGGNDYNGDSTNATIGLTLAGSPASNLTLTGSNTYTGDTDINSGTLTLGTTGALGATHINVNTGASLVFATTPGSGTVVRSLPGALSINSGAVVTLATSAAVADHQIISTASFSNSGLLDLGNGALDVPGSTGYQTISSQIQTAYNGGAWNGPSGITSTAAANNTTHLTTLGVIVNDDGTGTNTPLYGFGGTIAGTFSTLKPADGDILVKYTYYGDANLDGKVDGSDYSRIDNSYEQENWVNGVETGSQVTGWYNGDFNYDGNVDGSDYTLIDNAFNSQGASLASLIASPDASATAQIAGGSSAVPEPTSMGLLGIATAGLLGRRRRR